LIFAVGAATGFGDKFPHPATNDLVRRMTSRPSGEELLGYLHQDWPQTTDPWLALVPLNCTSAPRSCDPLQFAFNSS